MPDKEERPEISQITHGRIDFQAGRDIELDIRGDLVAGDKFTGDKILAETYIKQIIVQAAEIRELEQQPPEPGEPPFKGLQYFTEADAALFFGRSQLTATLVNRLHETRFLAVVGASGSGKSSVVRAGVVPAVKNGLRLADGSVPPQGNWLTQVLTPTATPLTALATALLPSAAPLAAVLDLVQQIRTAKEVIPLTVQQRLHHEQKDRLLLVVDQFEELFTLCHDEAQRQLFIDALVTAAHNDQQQLTVLFTLRADFYTNCLAHPQLRPLMRQYQEPIGAMGRDELLEAILRPTALHEWRIQEGLAELMLDEVGNEPGGLPLLSHALLETWHRRRGRTLTLSGYRAAGGVRGAIAQTAESTYRRLPENEREVVRFIFLRLTDLGERIQETRRRVPIASLQYEGVAPQTIQRNLQILAEARLITTDDGEVEVAHEALIREWPTLRHWLEEDRAGLLIHQRLDEAAAEWERLGRDAGVLYRGAQLAQLEEWAQSNQKALNASERAFWQASVAERERQLAEQEHQRQTAAQLQTQQRIGRILRWATTMTGLFLVIAVIAAVLAQTARGEAEQNFDLASTREVEANLESTRAIAAEAQAREAQRQSETNAQIALTQEAAAVVARSTSEANANLAATRESEANAARDDLAQQRLLTLAQSLAAQAPRLLESHQGTALATLLAVQAYRFNQTAGPGADFLIDRALRQLLKRPEAQTVFNGHQNAVRKAILSPDERTIVSLDEDGVAIMWPLNDPDQSPQQIEGSFDDIVLSADGRFLYGKLYFGGFARWELADLAAAPELLIAPGERQAIAENGFNALLSLEMFSRFMLSAPQSGDIFLATFGTSGVKRYLGGDLTADPQLLASLAQVGGAAMALSQDEQLLVIGGLTGQSYVVDLTSADLSARVLKGDQIVVHGVAIAPDRQFLYTAGADREILRWSLAEAEPAPQIFYEHSEAFYALALSSDGRFLAAGDGDGLILLWDLTAPDRPPRELRGHADDILSLQFDASGSHLLSASRDRSVRWWTLDGINAGYSTLEHPSRIPRLTFAPNGEFLAFADTSNVINVHFLTDDTNPERIFLGHETRISSLAVALDNKTIASVDESGALWLWDVDSEGSKTPFYVLNETGTNISLAWHPTEMMLAAAVNEIVYLWPDLAAEPLVIAPPRERRAETLITLAFSPTGEKVALGYLGGGIYLWETAALVQGSGEPQIMTGSQDKFLFGNLAFSRDGQQLAAGFDDNNVWLWSVANPEQEPLIYEGHFNIITAVAFDPNGRYLASISNDNRLLLWHIGNPTLPPIELPSATNVISTLAFAPDGHLLATSENNAIYLWPSLEQLVETACQLSGRSLTQAEWSRYMGSIPYEETCPGVSSVTTGEIVVLDHEETLLNFQREVLLEAFSDNPWDQAFALIVEEGDTEAALAIVAEIVAQNPEETFPPDYWNVLCWYGSLNGDAALVLDACETTVATASSSNVAFYRDSRGLARALSGDTAGAIEDFTVFAETFAKDLTLAPLAAKRQAWVEALTAGENPFTAEVLEELRTEGE